jgi:hypothetical protein
VLEKNMKSEKVAHTAMFFVFGFLENKTNKSATATQLSGESKKSNAFDKMKNMN